MNAAAYARYSTDLQTDNSIAYQLDAIGSYCREHAITITSVFTDEGQSGTNMDREGFRQLVAGARRHEFDAVVIYDISRGSRDVGDWFTFRKEMMLANVQVISATQTLGDLTNGNDFLIELLTVGMGQREVLETRSKSRAGVAVKAKEGAFLGGVPPLGYDIIDGKYTINDREAAAVRTIFRLYAAGRSYDDILAALPGVRGKRGRPLGRNSLHDLLKNERYVGVYTWNKKQYKILRKWAGGRLNPDVVRIEGIIPPIIERETWEKVQKRMSNNKRNAANRAKRDYLLSGMIRCECCGSTYVGHTSRSKKGIETAYYVCGNKYRTHTCQARNINAAELEEFVLIQLQHYLLTADFRAIAEEICRQVNGASRDLRAERAEIAEIDRKITNGMEYILSGKAFPELEDELDQLRIRKSELEDVIAHASVSRPKLDPAKLEKMFRDRILAWDVSDRSSTRAVVEQFVDKICANADGTVSVYIGAHMDGCGGPLSSVCIVFIPRRLKQL